MTGLLAEDVYRQHKFSNDRVAKKNVFLADCRALLGHPQWL
jgi:hypothetical protein